MHLLFRCPRKTCGTHFLIEYEKVRNSRETWFTQTKTFPAIHKKATIAKGVSDLSPRFVEILQQAAFADSQNLDELSGIGYGKALEFLIKDYCIHKNPEKSEVIRAAFLG